jgi:UDP-glucose 4-epimerase
MGDVTDAPTVALAMQGVDAVIHMAALLHLVNPPPTLRREYERINVGGTATVVEAALQAGVKRLVFFSTIAVYGSSNGPVLTEATPPHPETLYAQTKLDAEQIVLQARRSDGQPLGTVLRLGAVYGARVKGNYRRLVQALAHRRFIPIGQGNNRRTLIYDRDVARAAVLATQHPGAAGQIYNVSDGQFHPLSEIIDTICQVLGRRPPRFSAPVGPTRFTAGVIEDIGQLVGRRFPIGRVTIDKYIEDVAVDSQRIQRELEFAPQFDLKAGWRETIREMQKNGEL